jgi:hypothetical protein
MYYHRFACPGSQRRDRRGEHLFFGLGLIVLGVAFALANQGVLGGLSPWLILPALIALSGVARIVTARQARQVVKGGLHLVFAGWLYVCITHAWGLSFGSSWPFLIILVGARALSRGLTRPVSTTGRGQQ